MCHLLRITYRTGASVITVFGLGFGGAALGSDIGFVLGTMLTEVTLPDGYTAAICVVVVVACIVATIFVLRRGDLENLMVPPADDLLSGQTADAVQQSGTVDGTIDETLLAYGEPEDGYPSSPDETLAALDGRNEAASGFRHSLKHRCNCIAEEFGLSSRETDVLFLVAKGNDAKAIAEEFVVSYNTARTRIRNIYAKTNVHSRHDLFEIINDPKYRF